MVISYGPINFDGVLVKNYSTESKYYLSGWEFLLCWTSNVESRHRRAGRRGPQPATDTLRHNTQCYSDFELLKWHNRDCLSGQGWHESTFKNFLTPSKSLFIVKKPFLLLFRAQKFLTRLFFNRFQIFQRFWIVIYCDFKYIYSTLFGFCDHDEIYMQNPAIFTFFSYFSDFNAIFKILFA